MSKIVYKMYIYILKTYFSLSNKVQLVFIKNTWKVSMNIFSMSSRGSAKNRENKFIICVRMCISLYIPCKIWSTLSRIWLSRKQIHHHFVSCSLRRVFYVWIMYAHLSPPGHQHIFFECEKNCVPCPMSCFALKHI